ncbi:MAG: cation transporter [Deltaproteobacteria bacterium]|nr:cation transporter [Deltaproteobacteria bacterium]MBW2415209.1 cation transporter [Deltaproteobacteria bacterium]
MATGTVEPFAGRAVRAGVISLGAGSAIMAVKFVAFFLTGSTALLADASESIVNVIAGALLTYSLVVARRPADADHPYGHGKAEPLSAMFEGSLILIAASVIVAQAVYQLMIGPDLQRLGVGMALAGGTGVANGLLGLYLLRVARAESSEALRADAVHVLTDTITTAGGILALGLVTLTGYAWIDPVAGLLVAVNVVWAAWRVLRGALRGLLDEADFDLLASIASKLDRVRRDEWSEVHQLRAWSSGAIRHVDLHLVVPRYLTMEQGHVHADEVERTLLDLLGERGDVVVHVDPCLPLHCSGCAQKECPVRSEPLESPAPFTIESITRKGTI